MKASIVPSLGAVSSVKRSILDYSHISDPLQGNKSKTIKPNFKQFCGKYEKRAKLNLWIFKGSCKGAGRGLDSAIPRAFCNNSFARGILGSMAVGGIIYNIIDI